MGVQPGPGVAAPVISAKALEEVKRFLERYGLNDPKYGFVQMLLDISSEQSTLGMVRAWEMLLRRLQPFIEHHKKNPFATAPREFLGNGQFVLGFQVADNQRVALDWERLSQHLLVLGSTGSGKSTELHFLQHQCIRAGIGVYWLDVKEDAKYFCKYEDVLPLHRGAPFNLLQPPKSLSLDEFLNVWVTIVCRSMYGGMHTKAVLYEALRKAFADHGQPSIKDLKVKVDSLLKKTDTYARRDAVLGVSQRLEKFSLYPGLYETRNGVAYEEIFKRSLYIPVGLMEETIETVYAMVMLLYFLDCRARGLRDRPNKVFSFDESLLSFGKGAESSHIEAGSLVRELFSEAREFGISLTAAATAITQLDPVLLANSNTKIAMLQSSHAEAEAISGHLGLDPEQQLALRLNIQRGQAIAVLPGPYRRPILLAFPPLLPGVKEISVAEYEAAKRRWDPLLPPAPPGLPSAGVEEEGRGGPVEERVEKKKRARGPKVKLSEDEEALLRVLCEEGPRPGTEACRKVKLTAQAGTAAKKRLVLYQYVREEKVTVRSGRGGLGLVLFPEDSGFDAVGLKMAHGCRGHASPAHNYYCWELHRLLKDSQIEILVQGKKSVDLFFVYREEAHAGFLAALEGCGVQGLDVSRLAGGISAVGVEVEVSSGASAKTNVEKDRAVGVALVVEAVMPELLESVSRDLAGVEGVVVMDVLQLLDSLRREREAS